MCACVCGSGIKCIWMYENRVGLSIHAAPLPCRGCIPSTTQGAPVSDPRYQTDPEFEERFPCGFRLPHTHAKHRSHTTASTVMYCTFVIGTELFLLTFLLFKCLSFIFILNLSGSLDKNLDLHLDSDQTFLWDSHCNDEYHTPKM